MGETNHEHQGAGRFARLLGENHRRVLSTTLMRLELATWRLEERLRRAVFYPHFSCQKVIESRERKESERKGKKRWR